MTNEQSTDDLTAAFEAVLEGPRLEETLARHHLDESYVVQLRKCGFPLAQGLADLAKGRETIPIVGVNGSQGSGKSTLSDFLALLLEEGAGLRAAVLSIDDFYLTRAERQALGATVHPLFATRGVPGTHDVGLALDVLSRLARGDAGVSVPRFDKAADDRHPESAWTTYEEPLDLVLFEGWCVGCRPQDPADLQQPVNRLEADEDSEGRWRGYVNDQLSSSYAEWVGRLDRLLMLEVPSFECVLGWRTQQEAELIADLEAQGKDRALAMTPPQIERFIAHYERLTRHMLGDLPGRADAVVQVAQDHRMLDVRGAFLGGGGRA